MSTTVTSPNTTNVGNGQTIAANSFIPSKWEAALQYNYEEYTALPLITMPPDGIDRKTNQLIYNFMNDVNVTTGKLSTFNGTIPVQQASTTPVTLPIDDFAAWAVSVSMQDLIQGSADLIQGSTVQSARNISNSVDKIVYQDIINSAGITLPTQVVNEANAYNTLVNMATRLNWGNVPDWGRYFVIDPDFLGMLAQDPRFTSDPNVLANGIVEGQRIAGCEIICTTQMNYTPASGTGDTATLAQGQCFLIQKQGYAYGQQYVDTVMTAITLGSFLRGIQGMMIYGYGPLRKNNIVAANVQYQTELPDNIQEVLEE